MAISRLVSAAAIGLACAAAEAGSPPPAPGDVTVVVADRRIAAAWSPVAGAGSYKVAVRPRNGIVPFAWSEYAAAAPFFIVTGMWALGGVEYDVRVATVDGEEQSVWSPPVAVTAPELRPAPPGAIHVDLDPPHPVGAPVRADLLTHPSDPHPNDLQWAWFACEPDDGNCRLLPLDSRRSHVRLVDPEALGKHLRVQVDYEKDGVFYSAQTALGLVVAESPAPSTPDPSLPPGCPEAAPAPASDAFESGPDIVTHLYALKSKSASLSAEWNRGWGGGAFAVLCNDLVFATPWGKILSLDPAGRVIRHDAAVPMNLEEFQAHPDWDDNFGSPRFRVADVLLKRRPDSSYEMFVTHHYFTGSCIRFRLSSTTARRERDGVAVSSSWRTIFDADPCLPAFHRKLHEGGGKMLEDGPDGLLIVIGGHGNGRFSQASESHMGKLLRVDVGTGEAETLAFGLRNPQGLARDADGNLWETEHGPMGGDELNLLRPGADYGGPLVSYGVGSPRAASPRRAPPINYGWPLVSYGVGYDSDAGVRPADAAGGHDEFVRPVFSWIPSIGVSALVENDARWFPLWRDDLLVASLTGADGGAGLALFRVRRHGAKVQYVERIEIGDRIRDLAQMPDGRLALLGDFGTVLFLEPSRRCDRDSRRLGAVYAIGCPPLQAAAR